MRSVCRFSAAALLLLSGGWRSTSPPPLEGSAIVFHCLGETTKEVDATKGSLMLDMATLEKVAKQAASTTSLHLKNMATGIEGDISWGPIF